MRQRRKSVRLRAGFTLAEVAIAVGILAIIAGIALFHVRGKMPAYQVDRGSSAAWAQLRAARAQAVSEARPVAVALSPAARVLTVRTDRDEDGAYSAAETAVLDLSQVPGLTIAANCTNGSFSARGAFSCATGYWKLRFGCADARPEYVYVFAGGQVEKTAESL